MKTKVIFRLPAAYAAGAHSGIVLGTFNNWNIENGVQLHREDDGSLVAEITLTAGEKYEYRYLLSDGRWVNDDSARAYAEHYGHHVENCIVEVPVPIIKEKTTRKKRVQVVKKVAVDKKTEPSKKTIKAKKDDLTKIAGIGKKVAKLLNNSSIFTFEDLGKCTSKKLQLILTESGEVTKPKNPTTWTKQAKLAAAEKWEELVALQESIKG